ncbi:hypothetical protein GCM10028805_40630 [Spirosoma harenae]
MTLLAFGQAPQQKLRLQISYEKPGQYLEQAVDFIEAVNIIGKSANVEYKAGKSVTMLPGFIAHNGSRFVAEIKPVSGETGAETSLKLAASPNPFQHSTTIKYYLPADGKVNLWITDAQGKVVGQLVTSETQSAGSHTVEWTPNTLTDGVYIPIIEANQKKAVSRIVKN